VTSPDRESWFIHDVLPHEGFLRRYLSRFFADDSDIDDALQDTYARVIVLSDQARASIRSLPPFLLVTARNVALDRLRRQRIVSLETLTELDGLSVIDESPAAWEEINSHQELALLRRALESLPERCRRVLTLRKVYGLSQKDIAAKLAITENTVEAQVANGMRLCTARLYALMGEKSPTPASGRRDQSRGQKDVE
jgi:RNA polymerase sigma factor (sigma-70 family)